jgi:hypothetical protein
LFISEGDIVVVRSEGGLLQYARFVELFGFATGANMAMIHLSPYESPGIGIEVNRVLAKFPSSLEVSKSEAIVGKRRTG